MPHYLPGPAVIGSGVGMAIASVSSVLLEFTLALHYLLIPQNDFHEMVSGFHLKNKAVFSLCQSVTMSQGVFQG